MISLKRIFQGGGLLFHIGDKIVYPLHGAGIIEAIEEKEILGEKKKYYIIKMPIGNVQIMIPIDKIAGAGIRQVVDTKTMEKVLLVFRNGKPDSSVAWNQRYRSNMEKMRSGDLYKGAEVIRDLTLINKERPLGAGEKKMLDDATQIFISELVSVKGISEEQAADLLDELVQC